MTRRKAGGLEVAEAQDAAGNPACLLCGAPTIVFADPEDETGEGLASFDLCGRCNSAFVGLARALQAAQEARAARAETVAQVAGQLELDDAAACTTAGDQQPACRWAHGPVAVLYGPRGLCAICAADEVEA